MIEKKELLAQYLTSEYFPTAELAELSTVAMTLGNQIALFKQLYQCFLKQEPELDYQPQIGANMTFTFDYQKESVSITRIRSENILSFAAFRQLMALIDAIYAPIYPVGSVVELDESLLPDEVGDFFKGSELGCLVTLHARKIAIKNTHYIVDYVGTIWPLGMLPEVEPILINNLMIKRLVFNGLTNHYEEEYANHLKKQQLSDGNMGYEFFEEKLTFKEVAVDES